jgi:hypothetical protein
VRELLEQYGLQLSAVREAALAVVARPTNEQIVADLRAHFGAMMERLTPELEPAVVYSPRLEQAQ